jgi:hypothetical protein
LDDRGDRDVTALRVTAGSRRPAFGSVLAGCDAGSFPGRRHALGRLERSAGRRILLLGVMELNQLDRFEERSCLFGGPHGKDRSQGEVRRGYYSHPRRASEPCLCILKDDVRDARRANDSMNAVRDEKLR